MLVRDRPCVQDFRPCCPRRSVNTFELMNDDLLTSIRRVVAAVEPMVATIATTDHRRPTPCPDLDLGNLTAHLIGGLTSFAEVAEGKPLRFDGDPDLSACDAGVSFRAAADRLITIFDQPGMLQHTFAMPWGVTTGAQLLGFELVELLVHGWDIARSLDRDPKYDDDVVEAALAGARQWVDDSARTPQLFGPEVPVASDAPPLDRLVGFLGRQPTWHAGSVAP